MSGREKGEVRLKASLGTMICLHRPGSSPESPLLASAEPARPGMKRRACGIEWLYDCGNRNPPPVGTRWHPGQGLCSGSVH